jgi:WD40 repeat protein
VASGSVDQKVILWNPSTKQQVRTLLAARPIYSIAVMSIGKALAVALGTSEDVSVYNGSTGELYPGFRQGRGNVCYATTWMPNGPYLLTGRDYSLQLWDVPNNKAVTSCDAMAQVRYAAYAGNGSILVSGNDDRTVRFWDPSKPKGELRGAMLAEPGYLVFLTTDGQWRADTEKEIDLVYVVHDGQGQSILKPADFAAKFRWKNTPVRVKMPTR